MPRGACDYLAALTVLPEEGAACYGGFMLLFFFSGISLKWHPIKREHPQEKRQGTMPLEVIALFTGRTIIIASHFLWKWSQNILWCHDITTPSARPFRATTYIHSAECHHQMFLEVCSSGVENLIREFHIIAVLDFTAGGKPSGDINPLQGHGDPYLPQSVYIARNCFPFLMSVVLFQHFSFLDQYVRTLKRK